MGNFSAASEIFDDGSADTLSELAVRVDFAQAVSWMAKNTKRDACAAVRALPAKSCLQDVIILLLKFLMFPNPDIRAAILHYQDELTRAISIAPLKFT